jgi:hypothetical protein
MGRSESAPTCTMSEIKGLDGWCLRAHFFAPLRFLACKEEMRDEGGKPHSVRGEERRGGMAPSVITYGGDATCEFSPATRMPACLAWLGLGLVASSPVENGGCVGTVFRLDDSL